MKKQIMVIHRCVSGERDTSLSLYDGQNRYDLQLNTEDFNKSFPNDTVRSEGYNVYAATDDAGNIIRVCPMLERWARVEKIVPSTLDLSQYAKKSMALIQEYYRQGQKHILRIFDGKQFVSLWLNDEEFSKSFSDSSCFSEGRNIYVSFDAKNDFLLISPVIERWTFINGLSQETPYDYHHDFA